MAAAGVDAASGEVGCHSWCPHKQKTIRIREPPIFLSPDPTHTPASLLTMCGIVAYLGSGSKDAADVLIGTDVLALWEENLPGLIGGPVPNVSRKQNERKCKSVPCAPGA